MIEWIPFNRLINLQKIREEESEMRFMATWIDGIRMIKGEPVEYTRSRIGSCGVNLKILHGSQASDFFIEKLTNYVELEGNIVYGVTKDISKRIASNGKCICCKHNNTSPAWCQSCDPWKTTQEWTSGNEEIDNSIKEIQIKATEYEKVIEWIPYDRLINLQGIKESNQETEEIKEESNSIFMAT
ncbi:hypothetical protein C2G38_2118552, partial [Gigaspora rosea]